MIGEVEEFIGDLLRPGKTLVFGGERGEGKTSTAISLAQNTMDGLYGHENVAVITNVIFGKVIGGGNMPIEEYPNNVYHEDTLSGTMQRIGSILKEYGSGNVTILWILDEAQNFMLADLNGSKENLALTKYLGNSRKFDVCNMFLTPAINNLTPRVRSFPTGESKSGYCSCQIIKDKKTSRREVPPGIDPRSISYFITGPESGKLPIYIAPTSWTKGIYGPGVKPGSIGYDTKSTASFEVGTNCVLEPFDFSSFIYATSGGLSHQLPEKIEAYFRIWENQGAEEKENAILFKIKEQCARIERMRNQGITWKNIADIEGEVKTTLESRFKKYMELKGGRKTNSDADAVYIKPILKEEGEILPISSPSDEGEGYV